MTIDLQSIEERIKAEYNIAHAWVAIHPYAAVLAALLIGIVVGKLF